MEGVTFYVVSTAGSQCDTNIRANFVSIKKNPKIERFRIESDLSQILHTVANEMPRMTKTLLVEIALDYLLRQHSLEQIAQIVGDYFTRKRE
jgi:vacuolar-type H+-ATPase catalytic subunit A/Vma1